MANRKGRLLAALLLTSALVAILGCPSGGPMDGGSGRTPGLLPDLKTSTPTKAVDPGPGTFLFCFWNVENLFDDVDDGRKTRGDETYDGWLAKDKDALNQKLTNLRTVILGMNSGNGPDILALAEIESERAVELLKNELNRHLKPAKQYTQIAYDDPNGSRHIATAVLTRLPLVKDKTQLLGNRLRILETRVKVAGSELVIVASHWSSRLSDKTGDTRAKYGDQIHGRFRGMFKANPKVDFLVCGDFNDDPDEPSVIQHLHATATMSDVKKGGEIPKLFNPFAVMWAKDKKMGTLYYRGWNLFDQICVSAGMLDNVGWSYVNGSAKIIPEMTNRANHPNRFGTGSDKRALDKRGASDHYPVCVELRVK